MTEAEYKKILDDILPSSVDGMVRPTNPIPTDLPFSTDFPQLLQADMNLANHENAFLRRLFSNDKVLNALITAIQNQLASCELRIVTELVKGLMSPDMLKKLNGMQAGALNNPHPATHPATMITQDSARRMVSDTQINDWNGKAVGNHGAHVPTPQSADNGKFLRNDNTWQYVTPTNIGAYTKAEVDTKVNAKANITNPTFSGTVTAPTVTVTGTLNIPGGKIWIE